LAECPFFSIDPLYVVFLGDTNIVIGDATTTIINHTYEAIEAKAKGHICK